MSRGAGWWSCTAWAGWELVRMGGSSGVGGSSQVRTTTRTLPLHSQRGQQWRQCLPKGRVPERGGERERGRIHEDGPHGPAAQHVLFQHNPPTPPCGSLVAENTAQNPSLLWLLRSLVCKGLAPGSGLLDPGPRASPPPCNKHHGPWIPPLPVPSPPLPMENAVCDCKWLRKVRIRLGGGGVGIVPSREVVYLRYNPRLPLLTPALC